MKQNRFTETHIVAILKQQEGGRTTKDVCREHSISEATFYNWKTKGTQYVCSEKSGKIYDTS